MKLYSLATALLLVGAMQAPQQQMAGEIPMESSRVVLSAGDSQPLTEVRGGAITANGDLWIGQPLDSWIVRLDSVGRFVDRIGREGPGPGEFRRISRVLAFGDSVLVVDGADRTTAVYWQDDWSDIWMPFRIPGMAGLIPRGPTGVFADGTLLVEGHARARDANPEVPLARFDPTGAFRNIVAYAKRGSSLVRAVDPEAGLALYFEPPIHGGDLWSIVPGTSFLLLGKREVPEGEHAAAEIEIIDSEGHTIRTLRLSGKSRRVPKEALNHEVTELAQQAVRNRPFPVEQLRRMIQNALPMQRYLPLIDAVFADVCRRIWIRESAFGSKAARWLAYSLQGEQLGWASLPATHQPLASTSEGIWFSAEHGFGEPSLLFYRLDTPPCRRPTSGSAMSASQAKSVHSPD